MDIKANLESVKERIALACRRSGRKPEEVTLVAVTKTFPPAVVAAAFDAGIRDFGENRVQEAVEKLGQLSCLEPRPTWHLIGHLQSNKVKSALETFDIIHSVDSVRLAELISRHTGKRFPVLLQVNVSGERSKSGFSLTQIEAAYQAISCLPGVEVRGLMTIAPLSADPEESRPVFRSLRQLRDILRLEHLSMGMTDDFEIAIEEGATIVRIGRALFNERPGKQISC